MDPELLKIVRLLISEDENRDEFDDSELLHVKAGKGYPTIIPYSNPDAQYLAEHLSQQELRHLIRGLVKYSIAAGPGKSGGSVSPVSPLYLKYAERYPESEPELTSWVVEHRVNEYDPFGTISFANASSLDEHHRLRQARREEVASQEAARTAAKNQRQAEKATENLPNAVRRGDIKAVEALLGRGADPGSVSGSGKSLQALASDHGRDGMVDYLKARGIR